MYFKHITVIEFSGVLAGPAVGMFFAELGARVIKIENRKKGGDMTRNWKLPTEKQQDLSAYFCAVNYRKEYLDIDLTDASEREEAYRLIKTADVVLSNFKLGDDEKLGLTDEIIKTINPGVILGKIGGFASEKQRVAFDVVLQAETGYISMTGTSQNHLAKLPVAFIDLFAAHQLKEGVLVALIQKMKTGKGAVVEVNLEESALASLANQASNYLMRGHIPQPIGTQHPNIAPYGDLFFDKEDKPLLFAAGTDKQFESLCQVLNIPHICLEKRFKTNENRVKNRKNLNEILQAVVKTTWRCSLIETLIEKKVPCAAVLQMDEVFEKPTAKKMILEETIENQPTRRVKTAVFTIREL